MTRESVQFKISTKNKVDYIEFINHPFFKGKYIIQCQSKNCCSVKVYDKSIYLKMRYNGDIPHGKNRVCD